MTNLEPYQLSKSDLEKRFVQKIRPELFDNALSDKEPVLVLIGGQPGSGKTRATRDVVDACGCPLVGIVGDDLRAYHPQYEELLTAAPALMPDATAQASASWIRMSLDFALKNLVSAYVEGTFRRAEVTLAEAERFRSAGFGTHVVGLAVPSSVSRLSILGRFVDDVREEGQARWTSLDAHEAGYVGTSVTISTAEKSAAVDEITIRDRRGNSLFHAKRSPREGLEGAAQTLEAGRLAPMPSLSALEWLRDFHDRVAFLDALGEIEEHMVPLVRQLCIDAAIVIEAAHPDPTTVGFEQATALLSRLRSRFDA